MIYANRKGKEEIVSICNAIDDKSMIITNDVSNLKGGFINSIKRLAKQLVHKYVNNYKKEIIKNNSF